VLNRVEGEANTRIPPFHLLHFLARARPRGRPSNHAAVLALHPHGRQSGAHPQAALLLFSCSSDMATGPAPHPRTGAAPREVIGPRLLWREGPADSLIPAPATSPPDGERPCEKRRAWQYRRRPAVLLSPSFSLLQRARGTLNPLQFGFTVTVADGLMSPKSNTMPSILATNTDIKL